MFNPAEASENIKNEFIDYIATTYSFADNELQKQLINELQSNISKGPLLEMKDIFKSGKSINNLIDEGILSPLFRELERSKPLSMRILPLDRPLYIHQETAIRNIVAGKNAVISTGTGSGKTNCFLIPVLNELLCEQEKNTLKSGVRAMFIYPMNALANDQMKNIRHILMHYPDITFGVYNGATEYRKAEAVAVYEAMFATEKSDELRHKLPNEILSREEMKESPPNILFTNYAMLEHLLLRPKDDVLFSDADFKFVVLDEAHIYTGATGIETALLLRRLRARISASGKTQFILTSATLGSNKSSDDDILSFAKNLCGEDFDKDDIIRATRENYSPVMSINSYEPSLYRELAKEENYIQKVLEQYGIETESSSSENELLYNFLITSDLYDKMRSSVPGVCSINELARLLGVDMQTATAFISLCTRAYKNGKALLDARYHFFIRSLEGCYMTCGDEKKLFLNRRQSYVDGNDRFSVFEVAVCDNCGRTALVGKIQNNRLVQVSKLEERTDYFYPIKDDNTELDDEDPDENCSKEVYYICTECGAAFREDEINDPPCDCGKNRYIKVVKAKELKNGARCGNCHSGRYTRFYLGNDAATSVLATSLYEELPETEYCEDMQKAATTNIFARALQSDKKVARKKGRQFLVFSDSRQEAAKFACYLSKSYNEFLRRRGICHLIEENRDELIAQKFTVSAFVSKLTNFFSTKNSFAKSNSDNSNQNVNSSKNAWIGMLNELYRFNSATSLTSLGQIQFEYLGNTPEIIESLANEYKENGVTKNDIKNLLNLLAFEIVSAGALYPDSDSDIDDNAREYIFYSSKQRFIKHLKAPDDNRSAVTNWDPKSKNGDKNEYYRTRKMYYVCRTLKVDQNKAYEFLTQYFDYLTYPENGNSFCMKDINKDGTYVMPAKNFRVLVNGDPDAHWYKCQKCGRVTQFNIGGQCPSMRCEGKLQEINAATLGKDNHFAKLYMSDRMSPLFIKEHTAQLSKKESAEYQEQFIKKEINALSCSTTFELGVDVGDLETVFLRDIPPLPSNYAQRAGRAGRRVNSAAFVLTFAKLSSHDLSFFKEPEKMISGVILPPLFKVENEKIVRRHIYAVALSMFFAEHEDMYNHNDAEKFINEEGYKDFIRWINEKPDKLKDMLKRSIPDINELHNQIGINDFSWIDSFSGTDGVFTQLINEYESNVKNFNKQIKRLQKEHLEQAASCQRKLKIYRSNKLIDFLARGNILPRYGFPVNTVELYQNTTADNISKLCLSRDLQIAIAEYAPSSEVIADGRLYTSRYIKKSVVGTNNRDWHTAYIGECNYCHTVNYSLTPIPPEGVECISCQKKLKKNNFWESIEPRSGFVAERINKDVPMRRQEKNYRSDDYYIGDKAAKIIDKRKFTFNGVPIQIESTTNDSLLVKSYNSFYVCPVCGYSVAENESIDDPQAEKDMRGRYAEIEMSKAHDSLFGNYKCNSRTLKRRSLHHVFSTDVAKISFGCDTSDYNTMLSVMYAILNAVSKELNIERRDIKACLSPKFQPHLRENGIIIYDSVPGGAGHSRRLVTDDGKMLQHILMSALSTMKSCNCDPSCYNCLRCYENQKIHDMLDRTLAANFLKQFCGEIEVIGEEKNIT